MKCSLCLSNLLSTVGIFITITLNSLSGGLLNLHFISFLFCGFCIVHLIGTYFSVSPFCLIPYACFCVLGKSATSPSLEGVALFRRSAVGLRVTILPGHQSQVFKGCPLHRLHVSFCCGGSLAAAVVCWWVELACTLAMECSHSCYAELVGSLSPGLVVRPSHSCCQMLVGRAGPWPVFEACT